jgi:hypothetical protein
MTRHERAEAVRIASAYKRLVLLGRVDVAMRQARSLVGPDCAFHLCFRSVPEQRTRARRTTVRRRPE